MLLKEIEEIISDNKLFLFSNIWIKIKITKLCREIGNLCIVPCYADNDLSLKKLVQLN